MVYDVFILAAAVQFCDHTKRRPSNGWSRQFELRVPVHELDLWSKESVTCTLRDALEFLTGDQWKIKFKPRNKIAKPTFQRRLEFANDNQAVIAYSDGLDSLAVSMLEKLKSGKPLIHVRLGEGSNCRISNGINFPVTLVPFKVNYGESGSVETSSRSRGFRHALLSGVVAYLSDAREVIVPESGQGSLGPALVPVGQYYEDYRNHPLFTKYMESFLFAIFGVEIRYSHPRLWFTKGETLKELVGNENFDPTVLQQTRSCWQDQRHVSVSGKRRQCGICTACMLRRMSFHYAELSECKEEYVWENLSVDIFGNGIANGANEPTQAMKAHAVAGILHLKYLANFLFSELNRSRFDLHVNQLSEVLQISENEVQSKYECLLQKHENEWNSFLNSLGKHSFVSKWAKEF